jgi:hypothetical protein
VRLMCPWSPHEPLLTWSWHLNRTFSIGVAHRNKISEETKNVAKETQTLLRDLAGMKYGGYQQNVPKFSHLPHSWTNAALPNSVDSEARLYLCVLC